MWSHNDVEENDASAWLTQLNKNKHSAVKSIPEILMTHLSCVTEPGWFEQNRQIELRPFMCVADLIVFSSLQIYLKWR